jgi:hypothetical protein
LSTDGSLSVTLYGAQLPDAPPTNRHLQFDEGDEALGPISGVMDDGKNPSLPYADAVGAIPLDLKAELYQVAQLVPQCATDHVRLPVPRVVRQARQFLKSKRCSAVLAAAPKLTVNHAAALWLYTCESPLYRTLNRLLRARNRKELKAGFFPYLRLLLEAFARLGEAHSKPCMVNRGVAQDLVGANPDLYVKGSELTWWGFSSTTTDISALQVRRTEPNNRPSGPGPVL